MNVFRRCTINKQLWNGCFLQYTLCLCAMACWNDQSALVTLTEQTGRWRYQWMSFERLSVVQHSLGKLIESNIQFIYMMYCLIIILNPESFRVLFFLSISWQMITTKSDVDGICFLNLFNKSIFPSVEE